MFHIFEKGNASIHYELAVDRPWQLEEIRLHLSANGGTSENFTATIQSAEGSEYNLVVNAQDMNAVADEQYQPYRPIQLRSTDKILFEYTNTNFQQWGLEIIYR